MKKSQTTLTAICDLIAAGCLSQAEAARRCDVSVATYWSWISQSQKGNLDFVIAYCEESMTFHEAVKLARKIALHDVLGKYEQRMHEGTREKVFFQGRPQWKEREDCAGLDDQTVMLLFGTDRWERDANGQRIQLEIVHAPPIAGVIKLLEANFPKQYGQKSTVDINQRINLGVTTISRQPKPSLPVEILPPLPAISAPTVTDDVGDNDGDDLSELLGEEPQDIQAAYVEIEQPADIQAADVEIEEPKKDPMVSQPAPAPAPTIVNPRFGALTPEQAAILGRLRANIPVTAPQQPNAIVGKFSAVDPDDTDARRVGMGGIPKGGSKIV